STATSLVSESPRWSGILLAKTGVGLPPVMSRGFGAPSPRTKKPPPSQLAEEAANARDGIRVSPARQIATAASRPDRPVLQPAFVLATDSSISSSVKADLLVLGCVARPSATRDRKSVV